VRGTIQVRSLVLALGALVAAAFVALGLAFLFGTPVVDRSASAAASAPFGPRFHGRFPSIFVTPSGGHTVVFGPVVPPSLQTAGLVLLLAGLAGLGAILWIWRPWSHRQGGPSGFDQNIGMPNFL
jgi:hypothetical protein